MLTRDDRRESTERMKTELSAAAETLLLDIYGGKVLGHGLPEGNHVWELDGKTVEDPEPCRELVHAGLLDWSVFATPGVHPLALSQRGRDEARRLKSAADLRHQR